jgi:hypothetical protein
LIVERTQERLLMSDVCPVSLIGSHFEAVLKLEKQDVLDLLM